MSTLQVYKLCDHCNKEYEVKTGPALIEGVVSAMAECPHCGETNHVWMRFVINEGIEA